MAFRDHPVQRSVSFDQVQVLVELVHVVALVEHKVVVSVHDESMPSAVEVFWTGAKARGCPLAAHPLQQRCVAAWLPTLRSHMTAVKARRLGKILLCFRQGWGIRRVVGPPRAF